VPDPLPISALQHLIFCERQCALIHVEGLWAENRLTVEGRLLHRRAHAEDQGPRGGGRAESRPGVRIVRGLPLLSERLGLTGKADIVEFHEHPAPDGRGSGAGAPARYPPVPFPIEYKRGRPKRHDADLVQLCAQALCLEEMLALPPGGVPAGALFYGRTRRRLHVRFDADLRARTVAACTRLHELVASGRTPRARREKKCDRCSLLNLCLPDATAPARSAARYLERALAGLDTP
jgi:CRISPR-associated exonuclease Cas4